MYDMRGKFPTRWQCLQAVRLVVRVVTFGPTGELPGHPFILKTLRKEVSLDTNSRHS